MNILANEDTFFLICEICESNKDHNLSFKDLLNLTSTCKKFFSFRGNVKWISIKLKKQPKTVKRKRYQFDSLNEALGAYWNDYW